MRLRSLTLALGLALLAAAGAEAERGAPRAAASERLLEALTSASLAVVGELRDVGPLDLHGWRGTLTVESALVGDAAGGTPIPVVWEELSRSRAPRFADGDRVLLVLEPLTEGSLWRERIPDVTTYLATRRIAQRGRAFLRSPSPGSLLHLEHYLALAPSARGGAAGQGRLIALVAEAEPPLSRSAVVELQLRGAPGSFAEEHLPLVLRALSRADADATLAGPLLSWVEHVEPPGLAEALDRAIAAPEPPPGTWIDARARLPGGVPDTALVRLLQDPSPERRAAAVRALPPAERGRLPALVANDAAPAVRSAALSRYAALAGAEATPTVLGAFSDRDDEVRTEAALLASDLGPEGVLRLREVAIGWPDPAPQTAVLALQLDGSAEARAALAELADQHPDERIRALAALALGRPIGHED